MNVIEKCRKCKRVHSTKVYGCRIGESYKVETRECVECKERRKEVEEAEKFAAR
jgi:hypothetical protein